MLTRHNRVSTTHPSDAGSGSCNSYASAIGATECENVAHSGPVGDGAFHGVFRSFVPQLVLLLLICLVTASCSGSRVALRLAERELKSRSDAASAREELIQSMSPDLQPLFDGYGIILVHVPGDSAQAAREDFWIGLTEVTVEQYEHFVGDGGYADSDNWSKDGWKWRTERHISKPCINTRYTRAQKPIVCVSWYEADAYTRWLSRATGLDVRLPTEDEWERAATGSGGGTYPWGNDPPTLARANYCRVVIPSLVDETSPIWCAGPRSSTRVGSYPAGASPCGALDMAGNVWEWTARSWRGGVLRGGAWRSLPDDIKVSSRLVYPWATRSKYIGFRVIVVPSP